MHYHIEFPELADSFYISPYHRHTRIVDEPTEVEEARIKSVLETMCANGHLPTCMYNSVAFMRLREAVRANYQITWTSITPPMERLIYAISSTLQPRNVLCLGIFCGNTLTWNIGGAAGPGRVYDAEHLVGVEIEREPALLARRNLASIGINSVDVLNEDGFATIDAIDYPVDLLYLDAYGYDPESGQNPTKLIYLSMLKRVLPKLSQGAAILAHDTVNPEFVVGPAKRYLDYVQTSGDFSASYSVDIDEEGIEVTFKS